MKFVPTARRLLRAPDLADSRYAERLGVDDLARAAGLPDPSGNHLRLTQVTEAFAAAG